jgi:hypothetical protein
MKTAPMIYVMFLMRADPLRGQVGGGCALEMETFLGPLKWHRADLMDLPASKHYVQGRMKHRCIGSFMYMSSYW